jgi:hypothetical protein
MCSLIVVLGSGPAASSRTQKVRPACGRAFVRELGHTHSRLLRTAPPVALTSILGVLRRPASSADRLPSGKILRAGYSVLWIDYVRFLATGPGQVRYFLIPGVRKPLPAVCIRSLAPSQRRRYEVRARAFRSGSVMLEALASDGLEAKSFTAHAIEAGKALLVTVGPSRLTRVVAGVVPDGVASVMITPANGKTAIVPVADNFLLARTLAGGLRSLMVQWYAADGSLIRTIRSEPGSVLLIQGGSSLVTLATPPEVVRAGGRQLAQFERGRVVVAQLDAWRAIA